MPGYAKVGRTDRPEAPPTRMQKSYVITQEAMHRGVHMHVRRDANFRKIGLGIRLDSRASELCILKANQSRACPPSAVREHANAVRQATGEVAARDCAIKGSYVASGEPEPGKC